MQQHALEPLYHDRRTIVSTIKIGRAPQLYPSGPRNYLQTTFGTIPQCDRRYNVFDHGAIHTSIHTKLRHAGITEGKYISRLIIGACSDLLIELLQLLLLLSLGYDSARFGFRFHHQQLISHPR